MLLIRCSPSGVVACRKLCRPLVASANFLRALFELGVNGDQRLIIDARFPNTAFEAPDLLVLATGQSLARVNADTNDLIFVCGVDIQVAFHDMGLPEALQNMFALDPIEAWEVDFARVVDQGIVDSRNENVYPVLAVVLMGWNQALNVCQWVHEHIAEIY